ncbi:MAG TPA: sel1 repeat family protein, partial [Alphaproteobacteria bacterium]|nr:sel1 repeat family protein [Alphaproteobacteria bacterium]
EIGRDEDKAAKWFRMAAEHGHLDAQQNLGLLYASGKGVARNYVSAYVWWSQARDQGSNMAAGNLRLLMPLMSEAEISKAQNLVDEQRQQKIE